MTVNARIISALADLELPCVPDVYLGEAPEYLTFNLDTVPVLHGNDRPAYERVLIQVHYVAPLRLNRITVREQIKRRLWTCFAIWPEETNATDEHRQHWVYETEAAVPISVNYMSDGSA